MNRLLLSGIFFVCLCVFGVTAAAADVKKSGQISVAAASGDELPPPDSTTSVGAYKGVSEYRIGPQDLLEISVFQVAELNRTVRVNTSGDISLPLVGAMKAGGRTVQELESDIAKSLDAKFLQNPQVTVFVKEFTSQRVTLEGSVKKPGIYPLTGRTTLLQAIAMAEGLDQLADLRGIVIFRVVEGKKMGARFDIKAIRSGAAADPQVYGDDIIVIDQSGSKTAFRRLMESLPIFSIFSPL
ncbi:MAG: polysaccharide biosynthesis/export family protein [Arenimonas sp.]